MMNTIDLISFHYREKSKSIKITYSDHSQSKNVNYWFVPYAVLYHLVLSYIINSNHTDSKNESYIITPCTPHLLLPHLTPSLAVYPLYPDHQFYSIFCFYHLIGLQQGYQLACSTMWMKAGPLETCIATSFHYTSPMHNLTPILDMYFTVNPCV